MRRSGKCDGLVNDRGDRIRSVSTRKTTAVRSDESAPSRQVSYVFDVPVLDFQSAVGKLFGYIRIMAGKKNARSALAQFLQTPDQETNALYVQGGSGLIQEQYFEWSNQCDQQAQLETHPAGIVVWIEIACIPQTKFAQQRLCPFAEISADFVSLGDEIEMLPGGQLHVETRHVRHKSKLPFCLSLLIIQFVAINRYSA